MGRHDQLSLSYATNLEAELKVARDAGTDHGVYLAPISHQLVVFSCSFSSFFLFSQNVEACHSRSYGHK